MNGIIINMLSTSEQKQIGYLLAKMNQYSLNRPLMYHFILTELAKLCDIVGGPCSIVRVEGTDETSARIIGKPAYINLTCIEEIEHKLLWFKYVKQDRTLVLQAILTRYKQSGKLVDFANAEELLKLIKYQQNKILKDKLLEKQIKNINVAKLGYLWLILPTNHIWVISLRRKTNEGFFTEQHQLLLRQFGHTALGSQGSWYVPVFDQLDASCNKALKDKLTDRQFETLHHLGHHCSRKECAKMMGVSRATIDRNVETLLTVFRESFDEFNGKTISQIINQLKHQAFSYV